MELPNTLGNLLGDPSILGKMVTHEEMDDEEQKARDVDIKEMEEFKVKNSGCENVDGGHDHEIAKEHP